MKEKEGVYPGWLRRRRELAERLAISYGAFNALERMLLECDNRGAALSEMLPTEHPIEITQLDVEHAIKVAAWHGSELERIESVGGTEFTRVCRQVLNYAVALSQKDPLPGGCRYGQDGVFYFPRPH